MGAEKPLDTGIVRKIGTVSIPGPHSYVSEIEQFLEGNSGAEFSFPFVNQDEQFRALVLHLANSRFPFAVLVGEPGIGKTMMLRHVRDVVKGEVSLDEIAEKTPSLRPEFEALLKRAGECEHRDYLLLPNLRRPRDVRALDYTDSREIEKDETAAQEFCTQVVDVLDNYAGDYREKIRFKFDEADFRVYARAKINKFYTQVFTAIGELTKKNRDAALVTIIPRLKTGKVKYRMDVKWDFLNTGVAPAKYKAAAGYGARAKAPNKPDIERELAKSYIPEQMQTAFELLMEDLIRADLDGGKSQPLDIALEEFRAFNGEIIDGFRREYRTTRPERSQAGGKKASSKKLRGAKQLGTGAETPAVTQNMLLGELRQGPQYRRTPRISEKTLEDLESRIRAVRTKFNGDGDCSEQLLVWMDSVVAYFGEERRAVEQNIVYMLKEIQEQERESSKRRKPQRGYGADEDKKEKRPELTAFKLQHGDRRMPVKEIFQLNVQKDPRASGAVSDVTITDFSQEVLFAHSSKDDTSLPPHRTLTHLGTYFQGGILVFPDEFGRFVSAIRGLSAGQVTSRDVGASSMRERFLEALQDGELSMVLNGTTFTFKAPRIIIGCSNEDPFLVQEGDNWVYDHALRDRFKVIDVPEIRESTPATRAGTLEVIRRQVKAYEARREGPPIELDTEATDRILRETLIGGGSMVWLTYRGLTKRVDEVMHFAKNRGERKVTLDTLRAVRLADSHAVRFMLVDADLEKFGGYCQLPDKRIGFVNGLAIWGLSSGSSLVPASGRIGISSYIVRRKEKLPLDGSRFVLAEKEELADPSMNKGWSLAVDHIENILYALRGEMDEKRGWQVKTEFSGEWGYAGGPSASLPIGLSLLSALAGKGFEIYKNRFFTGTLDPTTGEVGPIGGVYYKSLTPTRIHERLKEEGASSNPMYFIFPPANVRELVEEDQIDPFGLEQHVTSIPTLDLTQAFYLATCGPTITREALQTIGDKSKAHFEKAKQAIKDNILEYDAAP